MCILTSISCFSSVGIGVLLYRAMVSEISHFSEILPNEEAIFKIEFIEVKTSGQLQSEQFCLPGGVGLV